MTHQFMYPKVTPVRQAAAGAPASAAGAVKPPATVAAGDPPRTG
jgi:hypothetical protein